MQKHQFPSHTCDCRREYNVSGLDRTGLGRSESQACWSVMQACGLSKRKSHRLEIWLVKWLCESRFWEAIWGPRIFISWCPAEVLKKTSRQVIVSLWVNKKKLPRSGKKNHRLQKQLFLSIQYWFPLRNPLKDPSLVYQTNKTLESKNTQQVF
jgi:hypothetical protein